MSTPYELEGRASQKQRTRDALVTAARELVTRGITPTVEQAAEAAVISRTTAYRYFPNQRALLLAAHPDFARRTLLPPHAPDDPGARFELAVDQFLRLLLENESVQRTMLRLSLERDRDDQQELLLRQGRAVGWFEDALSPLRGEMSQARVHRLAVAVRSAIGVEALVWLTDVAGLPRSEAVELMRWSARSLYESARRDGSAQTDAGPGA
jgi:hypothetical protein